MNITYDFEQEYDEMFNANLGHPGAEEETAWELHSIYNNDIKFQL